MRQETGNMTNDSGYKKLNLYRDSHELVKNIYRVTKKFPHEESFGLTSQIRRAAVSVPANIVEGYGRRTLKDRIQFYYIARGSLNELEYYIDLSFDLSYLNKSEYENLRYLREVVGRLLNGFIKSSTAMSHVS